MAINLTIALSDAEQAAVEQAVAVIAPALTPAQVKNRLEAEAKRLLFASIKARVREARERNAAQAEVNARAAEESALVEPTSPF